jgi:hypothetical protein
MFGLLVAAGVVGGSRIGRSWIVPALTGIALVLSIPLLGVSSFVWSDGAFALVVALFLLNVSTIGIRESAVALSGLLAGVATVTRYVGVTTIPIGVLAIVRWGRRSRRLDLLLFLVLAVLPAAAWVARNLVVTSTLAGTRHSATDGLEVPIRDTGRTIGNWVFPGHPHAGLAVAAVLSLMAMALVRRYPPVRLEVVAFFFCAVYVIWLLTSAASVALDPIDDRFLAPIYVPLTWLVVGMAGRLVSIAESRAARVSSLTALAVVAGAWAFLQASELGNLRDRVELSSLSGVPRWTKSDERRAHRMSRHLYSNAPDAVYLRTGAHVHFSPRRSAYRSDDPFDELAPLRERLVADGHAVLIWFKDVTRPAVYSPAELRAYFEVARVAATSSATLYRIRLSSSKGRAEERANAP